MALPGENPPSVDRDVKLPDGRTIRIRVPTSWGRDEVRQALESKGVLSPQAAEAEDDFPTVWKRAKENGLTSAVADEVAGTPAAAKRAFNKFWDVYTEESSAGLESIFQAISGVDPQGQPSGALGRAGHGAIGVLRTLFSPLTGGAAAIGNVFKESARDLGASPQVAANIGQGAEMTALVFSGGVGAPAKAAALTRTAGPAAARAIAAAEQLPKSAIVAQVARAEAKASGAGSATLKKVDDTVRLLTARTSPVHAKAIKDAGLGPSQKANELFSAQLREGTVKALTEGSAEALAGNFDKSKRLFENIADLINAGDLPLAQNVRGVMAKYGISQEQMAKEFSHAISTYGRGLANLSRISKSLDNVFDDAGAKAVMQGIRKKNPEILAETWADKWWRMERSAVNLWRSLLVSQMATAMRNAVGGTAFYTHAVVEETMADMAQAMFKMSKGQMRQGFTQMLNSANAAVRTGFKLTKENRKELLRVLDDPNGLGPMYHARLVSNVASDVVMGKAAWYINTMNRIQEFAIRGTAMEFKMRQLIKSRMGKQLEEVLPENIPKDLWETAYNFGMRTTFAEAPKSLAMQSIVKAWHTPVLGTALSTINPFPRFTFANALPFVVNRSPLGVFRIILNNDARKGVMKVLSKDAKNVTIAEQDMLRRIFSETAVGMLFMESANRMRNSDHAGQRWYEIKQDPKDPDSPVIDVRPVGPYAAYMFMAEYMARPDKIEWQDFVEVSIGLRQVAGTALVISDLLRAKSADAAWLNTQRFLGQVMGAATIPARQVRDMVAGDLSLEDTIIRDTRQDPMLGPLLNNVPILNRKLPVRFSPLRKGTLDMKAPTQKFRFMGRDWELNSMQLRQLTGISLKVDTELMRLVQDLDISPQTIYPRTGLPEADNKVAKAQGYYMHHFAEPFMRKMRGRPATLQKAMLEEFFMNSKAYGMALLKAQFPRLHNASKEKAAQSTDVLLQRLFTGTDVYTVTDEALGQAGFGDAPGRRRNFEAPIPRRQGIAPENP